METLGELGNSRGDRDSGDGEIGSNGDDVDDGGDGDSDGVENGGNGDDVDDW